MRLLRCVLVTVLLACTPKDPGTVGEQETGASTDTAVTTGTATSPTGGHAETGSSTSSTGHAAGTSTSTLATESEETETGTDDTIAATTQLTGANDTEVVPVADCTCVVEDIDDFGEPYLRFSFETCSWSPCGEIELGCDQEEPEGDEFCVNWGNPILDIKAVDCSLDVLIAGTPAYLRYVESPDGGFSDARGFVKIGEGRIALAMTSTRFDLEFHLGAIEILELKPAEYFVGCKALADPRERYECLKEWITGPALETCAPPQNPA